MRLPINHPRPDQRPKRKGISDARLAQARRNAWLESSRPVRFL